MTEVPTGLCTVPGLKGHRSSFGSILGAPDFWKLPYHNFGLHAWITTVLVPLGGVRIQAVLECLRNF